MRCLYISIFLSLLMSISLFAQDPERMSPSTNEIVSIQEQPTTYYTDHEQSDLDGAGLLTSKVISYHEDGSIAEKGLLIKGQKNGVWVKYNTKGQLINEAFYKNNLKDGVWRVWDDNGRLRLQYSYDLGQRSGTWFMYNENGDLLSSQQYD